MKKIWIALLAALLLCGLLAGCGGDTPEPSNSTSAGTENSPSPSPSEEASNPPENSTEPSQEPAETGSPARTVSVAERGTAVTIMTASEWESQYPDIYASYMANGDNESVTDYVADYPMIAKVYEGMAFNKFYSSARGHVYTVADVTETGRPHALANCFSCKTPQYSAMVNESNGAAYTMPFEEAQAQITEPITCYSCHANTPGEFTISNLYLADAVGADLNNIPAETLSCAQCHVEYYFAGAEKATTLPYSSLATMDPDAILDYYNSLMVDGQPFADYTNPRTGVRQIKVQHPEFETFMGEGSKHKANFTCADCHMVETTNAAGETYTSHTWISPLESQELIDNTCSACHADIKAEVQAIQTAMEDRTIEIGYQLEELTDALAEAVESGEYTEEELDEIRELARTAQFYWDFVFVENSEGAHNSTLDNRCLDKAEDFVSQAMALLK